MADFSYRKRGTFNQEYGSNPNQVCIGSPSTDYRLLFDTPGSSFNSPVSPRDYSRLANRIGPPPNDPDNGRSCFLTGGRATCELIGLGRTTEGAIWRAQIMGWRPMHPLDAAITGSDRKDLYGSVLWVRRPLAEITCTLGVRTLPAGSTDGSGISSASRFAKTITKVADYTWSQNARAISSGGADVAAFFFDCSGFPIVEVAGTREEIGASGPSSGASVEEPAWFNFLYALA